MRLCILIVTLCVGFTEAATHNKNQQYPQPRTITRQKNKDIRHSVYLNSNSLEENSDDSLEKNTNVMEDNSGDSLEGNTKAMEENSGDSLEENTNVMEDNSGDSLEGNTKAMEENSGDSLEENTNAMEDNSGDSLEGNTKAMEDNSGASLEGNTKENSDLPTVHYSVGDIAELMERNVEYSKTAEQNILVNTVKRNKTSTGERRDSIRQMRYGDRVTDDEAGSDNDDERDGASHTMAEPISYENTGYNYNDGTLDTISDFMASAATDDDGNNYENQAGGYHGNVNANVVQDKSIDQSEDGTLFDDVTDNQGSKKMNVNEESGDDIMLETRQGAINEDGNDTTTERISADQLIEKFKMWGRDLIKRKPQYNDQSRLDVMKKKFFGWLNNLFSKNKDKPSKNPDMTKILEDLLKKLEKDQPPTNGTEVPCGECFTDQWMADDVAIFHDLLINEQLEQQKIFNQIYQSASNISDQSREQTKQWFTNSTGLNSSDLDSVDLMSLNQGYHVHYPPNHITYPIHRPQPSNHHVDYHVHYHGNKINHYFDHYYGNGTGNLAVNHYISKTSPCLNGGVMLPLQGSEYQCICKKGFIGTSCEDFDYCSLNPCKNLGKCNPIDISPRIHCTCSREYYGKLCGKRNPCYPTPCKNHGKCSHDQQGRFECVCKKGYRGKNCQYIDSCYPSPCMNDGQCHSVAQIGSFYCECPQTYKGSICQYPTICPRHPCNNGAECRETDDNDFQCVCKDGFIGRTCDERPCSPNPCMNAATCVENGNAYKCLCNSWTAGVNCSTVSPCKLKPCGPNGKCVDADSGYKWSFKPMQYYCLCKPPWMGPYCTDNMCSHCSPNAHCDNDSKCACDEGYTGDGFICEENEKNSCDPNPCLNGGKCIDRGNGNFQCECVLPYQPPICSETDPCKADPCHNGRCIPNSDGSYRCVCFEGFEGAHCNVSDPCRPNPCQNRGTCTVENKKAKCSCVGRWTQPICKECGCPRSTEPAKTPDSYCDDSGQCQCYTMNNSTWEFTGQKCQRQSSNTEAAPATSLCQPNPCLNGGTCIEDTTKKSYRCLCSRWFSGKSCETLKACVPHNPCLNGGTCNENGKGGYTCKCPPGTSPPMCAASPTMQSPTQQHCESQPCKNNGVCVELKNGYDCHCKSRFTGPTCEIDRCQDCDENARCVLGHCYCNEGFIGNGYECLIDDTPQQCTDPCSPHGYCAKDMCNCYNGYTMIDQNCVWNEHLTPPTEQPVSDTTSLKITSKLAPTANVKPTNSPTQPPATKPKATPEILQTTAQPAPPTKSTETTTKTTTTKTTKTTKTSSTTTLVPPLRTTISTTVQTPTSPITKATDAPSTSTRRPPDGGDVAPGPPGSKKSLEKLLEIRHPPGFNRIRDKVRKTLAEYVTSELVQREKNYRKKEKVERKHQQTLNFPIANDKW